MLLPFQQGLFRFLALSDIPNNGEDTGDALIKKGDALGFGVELPALLTD
jgi:hypothetical protein